MTSDRTPGTGLVCLVLLIMIATIAVAGCTDSAHDRQIQETTTHDQPAMNPASGTAVATKTTASPVKTTRAVPAPVSSTGVIKIDPIGDKKTGETFTLTGTTSLPEGTSIIWQIMPDTGTPPTGLDPDSQMSVGGNYLVTKGDGTLNRISLAVDLGRLVPGKYVAIVGKMKGDQTTGMVFEIGNDYGYTSFTLK
jgi:hypothetical protein